MLLVGGFSQQSPVSPHPLFWCRLILTSITLIGSQNLARLAVNVNVTQVSAIIDVDIVPETCRRVRLLKHGSDKPLGFYIRDGTSVRVTPAGLEKVPGIFISRLVPGGLAESTGLLAVNDEVLEVNGIEVAGKTLDQVTDMMVANSSNLIITVKPANQRTLATPQRGSFSRTSQLSSGSQQSTQSVATTGSDDDHYDQDEIVDLTGISLEDAASQATKDDGILHLHEATSGHV
ncbi:hypothetical protein PR048_029621 [Dryococelus australis]|uniref:PDZ domain-containing protein n=1 Tax=Dryococelus australis TaxID=614101 RepID=A0ABQ9GG05_9NEOP|nr:hypothetical protein PR048_029621 [Dryococelus australis]